MDYKEPSLRKKKGEKAKKNVEFRGHYTSKHIRIAEAVSAVSKAKAEKKR